MNTRKTVTKQSPHSKSKPNFLFILRNLRITDHTELTFKQVRIKRVYLKGLYDEREKETDRLETPYKPFKHNKLLKTLKNAKIPSLSRSYAQESLKYSKRIKMFKLNAFSEENQMSIIATTIKRFPITVRSIHLNVVNGGIKTDPIFLSRIAQSIRKLPNLQYFHRWYLLDTEERRGNHVLPELFNYDVSALRLKKMKKIVYSLGSGEQKPFQRLNAIDFQCPGINALKLYLTSEELKYFERNQDHFEPDDSQLIDIDSFDSQNWTPKERRLNQHLLDSIYQKPLPINPPGEEEDLVESDVETIASQPPDEDTAEINNVKIPSDLLVKFLMREDMRPFYRYHNFPNLKKLGIIQEDAMYPLGSFVVHGFSQLQKLQDFKLDIMGRSAGSTFLFKGFLQLPLLRKFSLHITFIKNEDWALLEQFMKVQNNLESFSLMIRFQTSTRDRYLAQNVSLGNILRDLQNKPRLKTLRLRSAFWPIETISKALGELTLENQLEEIRLEASDETISSQEKLWKRVEGLCNFIKNQKGSLRKLFLFLPCVVEDSVVTHIAEAISKLTSLKELFFSVNSGGFEVTKTLMEYFENTLQFWVPDNQKKKMVRSKMWNPSVAKYLKRLESLEDFSFCFNRLDIPEQKEQSRWFLDVMKVLPSLERLRNIWINSDSGDEFWEVEEKMSAAVLELRNVRVVNVTLFDRVNFYTLSYSMLKRAVKTVNERQAMRCDLMF